MIEISEKSTILVEKHNFDIVKIEKKLLLIKINGTIDLPTVKKVFRYIEKYSKTIQSRVDIVLDSKSITAIDIEARSWLMDSGKNNDYIDRAISFGKSIFLGNILLVLLNLISHRNDIYREFNSREEALSWLLNS